MTRSSSHDCMQWVDCHYTRRDHGDVQITQSTNDNLVEQILLNHPVATQQGQNLKLKGCYCSPKRKKLGCQAQQSSWETFCLRGWMLSLNFVSHCASHHTIGLTHTGTCQQERCVRLHRDEFRCRGGSVGREKGSCVYVLGQMTLAIELRKSIGH